MKLSLRFPLLILLLVWGAHGHAAWVVEPSARVTSGYEDNVTLDPDDEDGAVFTSATAQARLRNVTETGQASGTVGVDYTMYSGTDLDDRETWYLDLSADRRLERGIFRVLGQARRDIVLRRLAAIPGELDGGADPAGDPLQDLDELNTGIEEGLAREQIEQIQLRLSPELGYRFTERTEGTIGYRYFGLRFDEDEDDAELNVEESDTHAVFGRINHQLSARDDISLNASFESFDPDESLDSDNYEGTVGWQRRVSDRIAFGFEAGARYVDSDESSEWGFVYRANGSLQTETGRLLLRAERSVIPSPYGDIVEADRANLSYLRRIGERGALRLNARAFQTSRDGGGNSNRDRKFFSVGPEVSWALSRSLQVGAGYAYRWNERDSDDGSAQSNLFSVNLTFRPPRAL